MNENREEKKEKRNPFVFCILFVLTVACNVFAVLCITSAPIGFLERRALLFSILACVLICVACGVAVWSVLSGKESLFKAFLSAFIFLLFCLLLVFIMIKTGFFDVIKDAESLQKYLEASGAWMPILYIVLQYLQVVILPIPSIVSTAAGVALFGAFRTMLYSLLGIVLGSLTAFLIGRKLGYKAVVWMVGEETLEKWQSKLKGKDNFFLTVMFLLPLFPDDVLCLIAGLSTMSLGYFTVMIILSRVIAIATTCYSVDFIPLNEWWGILLWVLFFIVFIIVFMLIYKNMDKIQEKLSKRFKFFEKKGKK